MNDITSTSPAVATPPPEFPAPHRDIAQKDLLVLICTLGCLTIAGYFFINYLTATKPVPNAWPVSIAVDDTATLALTLEEQEQFDRAVFRMRGRATMRSLSEAALPPLLPTLENTTDLWLLPPRSALRQESATDALRQLRDCASVARCSLKPPADRESSFQIIAALGKRNPASNDICDGAPHNAPGQLRVPAGLYAIALSWAPRCHASAIIQFGKYEEQLASNLKNGELTPDLVRMGQLYAKLAGAKLKQGQQDDPASPAFRKAIGEIHDVVLSDDTLRRAYEDMAELPAWGLSTAEIRAAWTMANARETARTAPVAELAKALHEQHAYAEDLSRLKVNPSPGQNYLRNVSCAIALRASSEELLPRDCYDVVLNLGLPAQLHCAVAARKTITDGSWQTDAESSCPPNEDGAPHEAITRVFEHVASKSITWGAALQRYRRSDLSDSERAALTDYLESYAIASGNRMTWFSHKNPDWVPLIDYGRYPVMALWIVGLWATWRLSSLRQRFLPPRMAEDRISPA